MPAGRPTDYTQELAIRLCSEIALGRSLRKVCLEDWSPCMSTIFRWLLTNKEFKEQYAIASQQKADAHADEIQDLADDVELDQMAIAKAKLQIDTRKWIASKLKPKKYGEKIEVGGDQENPVGISVIERTFVKADNSNG